MTNDDTTECTATAPSDDTATEPVLDPPADGYHVVIIGGGPAGCAAGLFCARAGLETLLVRNERSTLQKCAFVENYLGFPPGIDPPTLLELMHKHVEHSECDQQRATVETIERSDSDEETPRFLVHIDGESIETRHLLAASWSSSDYLDSLGVKTEQEPDGPVYEIVTDNSGLTNVDGIYAAGRITGTHHQALVNAGDGARVGLNIVEELIPEFYNDWVVPAGYYEQYDREVPVGVEEITHETRTERTTDAHQWLATYFTDEP